MADYKSMYHILFNEVTNAIEQLQTAQQKAEECYINSDEDEIIVLHTTQENNL